MACRGDNDDTMRPTSHLQCEISHPHGTIVLDRQPYNVQLGKSWERAAPLPLRLCEGPQRLSACVLNAPKPRRRAATLARIPPEAIRKPMICHDSCIISGFPMASNFRTSLASPGRHLIIFKLHSEPSQCARNPRKATMPQTHFLTRRPTPKRPPLL